jgi:hypothetical protein
MVGKPGMGYGEAAAIGTICLAVCLAVVPAKAGMTTGSFAKEE